MRHNRIARVYNYVENGKYNIYNFPLQTLLAQYSFRANYQWVVTLGLANKLRASNLGHVYIVSYVHNIMV